MITTDHYNEIDKLLKACLENDEVLTEWERDYVSDFTNRLAQYGEKLNVSDKQQQIFDRLEKKLQEAGVL